MTSTLTTVDVVIYSRPECSLCDEAKLLIEKISRRHRLPVVVTEVDIDADPELRERYSDQVPVIFVDGRKAFKYRVVESELVDRIEHSIRSRKRGTH